MIRKVSIPLVVGMVVAAGVGPSAVLSSVSLIGAAILLAAVALKKDTSVIYIYLLFLLTGIFSYSSYSLAFTRDIPARLSASGIISAIDSTGFRGDDTRGLLKALLAGDRSSLAAGTAASFRQSGASHLLALSGLHLGIIYLIVNRILSIAGNSPAAYRTRSIITMAVSGAYTLMTGAAPSTVRALLFISLNEIAKLHPDRKKDSLNVFWTAITIQLAVCPTVLESAGFQLSYLAMLGIFLVFPVLKSFYPSAGYTGIRGMIVSKMDLPHRIWDSAALAISCQMFTAPLAWFLFGTFPKYFLLTNLIALPLTEILVTGGLLCSALSCVGLCPDFLTDIVDRVATVLVFSLETISGM